MTWLEKIKQKLERKFPPDGPPKVLVLGPLGPQMIEDPAKRDAFVNLYSGDRTDVESLLCALEEAIDEIRHYHPEDAKKFLELMDKEEFDYEEVKV